MAEASAWFWEAAATCACTSLVLMEVLMEVEPWAVAKRIMGISYLI